MQTSGLLCQRFTAQVCVREHFTHFAWCSMLPEALLVCQRCCYYSYSYTESRTRTSTQPSVRPRLERMARDGIQEVPLFRLLQRDGVARMPQDWWWPALTEWVNAA